MPSPARSAATRRATRASCFASSVTLLACRSSIARRLNTAITELRDAHAAAERLRSTDAGRAHEIAALLQQALDVHAHAEGERCPVCGTEGVLTYQWRVQARDQVVALRAGAEAVRTAHTMLDNALRQARQLVTAPLRALRDGAGAGIDITAGGRGCGSDGRMSQPTTTL